jgi:hypothetical protein
MAFRVKRLDFWDYRFPTGWVFESLGDAEKKARDLERLELDPMSCYFVEQE